LAGPFSALWIIPEQPNWLTLALINLAALFAHPLWPNRVTATLTFLALASWLFWGMAVSFPEELAGTIQYLILRLQRGVTADVALESKTLKVLKVAGLLTSAQESSLVRSINRVHSIFLSHSS